jgi:hypothetical protein
MRSSLLPSIVAVLLSACAAQKLQPVTVSSASSTGYALGYPDSLRTAADSFARHKQQAHALSSKLVSEAPQPKPTEDRSLLLAVIDQADADGRREDNVQTQRTDRELRKFWDAERSHIAARVDTAVQKQLSEANCKVETQAAVSQALRDAVSRQLDKRGRKTSEAQRYLDQIKPQLSAATWNAAEDSADDVTLTSYIVYVALVDDVLELQRLRNEHDAVVATLQDALTRERAAISGTTPASRKRVQLLESRLAAVRNESLASDDALRDYEAQLKQARSEYEQALAALRAALTAAPQHP